MIANHLLLVKRLLFLTLFVRHAVAEKKATNKKNTEHAVLEKIFKNYNKYVRPVKMYNDSIQVLLDPALYGIYEVNEAQETITFSQWYRANWQDEFLTWDPEEFGGIEMIKPPASMIWIPDLTLYGMIEVTGTLSDEQLYVHLNYTGHVLFSIGQNIRVHCTYDVSRFPFDKQRCVLHYTSWMFHDGELSLYPMSAYGVDEYFQRNTEWSLESFKGERKTFTYDEGTYSEVFYYIDIQRKPLYYMLTIVVPSFAITSLSLIGLFSPFNNSGDRQEKVPINFDFCRLFIMFELLISSLATFIAVLVMYLHRSGADRKPPRWLLRMLLLNKLLAESDRQAGKTKESKYHYLSSLTSAPSSSHHNHRNNHHNQRNLNSSSGLLGLSYNHHHPQHLHHHPNANGRDVVGGGLPVDSHHQLPKTFIGGNLSSSSKNHNHHRSLFQDVNHTADCMDRRLSSMASTGSLNNNYHHHASSPVNNQKESEAEMIRVCLDNLRDMTKLLRDWKAQNELATVWTKVCDRVDMMLIFLFFLIHSMATILFFVVFI